jgi:hypothetical protein
MIQTTVGTSSRTPFKHWLLNHMLGRIVGALSSGRTPCNPSLTVIDMCAGDGLSYGESAQSSPAIIAKHISSTFPGFLNIKSRTAHLFEREEATFGRLRSRFGGKQEMTLNMEDSKGWTLKSIKTKPRDCIFVYADPNSITTLPVTNELIDSFTPETLFLMTLGCNVGGCKRLPREDREQWMRTAISVTDKAHNRHDIILVWLVRDASQWAYLAAVPSVWAADTLASSVKAGNKLWAPNGVDALSLRIHGRQAINDKFKELFLTANEIKENA